MSRKIISIAISTFGESDNLYALADDGSVWRLHIYNNCKWRRVPSLPEAKTDNGER